MKQDLESRLRSHSTFLTMHKILKRDKNNHLKNNLKTGSQKELHGLNLIRKKSITLLNSELLLLNQDEWPPFRWQKELPLNVTAFLESKLDTQSDLMMSRITESLRLSTSLMEYLYVNVCMTKT